MRRDFMIDGMGMYLSYVYKEVKLIITAFVFFVLSLISGYAKGQTEESLPISDAIHGGKLSGDFRYFFMLTDNQPALADYYANAFSGSLHFETLKFHQFQFAIGGASILNLKSSDLSQPDLLTGQLNRYEIGLFDITNPNKKHSLNRLEELYLKYHFKKSYVKVGRQFINTNFINLQDGRMRPTAVEGFFAEVNEVKKMKIQFSWLWAISPRSTVSWYHPGASIGIYPSGLNPDGTKSDYRSHLINNGIGLLEINAALFKNMNLQFSNIFVENMFNTSLLQMDYSIPLRSSIVFIGVQSIGQYALSNGGSLDQNQTYYPKDQSAFTFGSRVGIKNNKGGLSINYNRITAKGRYLFPREWGKDPFFTFLPRERNDGFGDLHAFTLKADYSLIKDKLTTGLGGGYYHLPDVKNYALNKYGMPSYTQLNIDVKYNFKRIGVTFLAANKLNMGNTYHNDKYVINKVGMTNYNFILNYQL